MGLKHNIQNSAKITTPLVEKEGETVTDYEYLFSMNLQARLKERIQGAVFVKVDMDDNLIVKITRRDKNNFEMSISIFSDRMLNGFTTEYAAYHVRKEYRDFVMEQFFK